MGKLSTLGVLMLVIPIIMAFVLMLYGMVASGMGKELMIVFGMATWIGTALYLITKD